MALSEHLQKKLEKQFPPSSMQQMKYKGNDLSFKIDADGNAILLFIGKQNDEGKIKGERYARRLVKDRSGKVIKDHWELKGKAS